jgi:preprotein translocase subunit SecD
VAAPSGQLKVRPYFTVLAILVALLYVLVFATGDHKAKPKLGLDLVGGTSLTMTATTIGGRPTSDQMTTARSIINQRVDAVGVSEAEVVIQGKNQIVVNVAGQGQGEKLSHLLNPAKLEFRAVLGAVNDTGGVTPTPSASGSTLPTPTPSGSTSAPAAQPSPSSSAKGDAIVAPSATPTPSPSGSASPAPSPSTTPSAGSTPAPQADGPTLAEVQKKLGAAYTAAGQVTDPTSVDAATLAALKPFSTLSFDEVGVLPTQMQFSVPTISCTQLDGRNPSYLTDAAYLKQQVVACETNQGAPVKYLLDVAKVNGTDISSAVANYDATNYPASPWIVNLSFKGSGQAAWTKLTQDAKTQEAQDGQPHQVAVVLDTQVVSAPSIESVITGPAVITGLGETGAHDLAQQLKFGALPISFHQESASDVSATLGLQQLRSGMLAGAIGLALVVVYCLFYYRALGLVVIASLAVSASIVFASLVLLGRAMGFTLSLAGIAGFIVAIGITADSFVVFFERLKDEVKEGRTARSAVPRAWVRARRTILSADAVSFIAAVVLFLLASGPVAGFAFTLGLSTVVDLIVVFLFTHPFLSVLSGSRTFTSPRFSGLGGLREGRSVEDRPAARVGAMRTKES